MKKNIDIRIMKLNKWYVPKSFDLDEVQNPVVLGFFDELKVEGVTENIDPGKLHPFMSGYKELIEWKIREKEKVEDFSSQEQILFLNIGERDKKDGTAFSEETVREFWSDKGGNYPYIFLSMIHICHKGNLVRALKKIKRTFRKNYLAYVSYDYCDIVLFAHNVKIRDFLNRIRKLFILAEGEEKIIFDTFSMVSFWPPHVREQASQKLSEEKVGVNTYEKFHVTINVSVRNYEQFKEWYESNIKNGYPRVKLKLYNIYGRHDVSITNEKADVQWLMWIMQILHDKNNQKMFWTFETFIKVIDANKKGIGVYNNLSQINKLQPIDELEQSYGKVRERLETDIRKLINNVGNLPDPGKYILPVYEVRDCICSIVKNGFAEEFVCCIYESFLHFISYLDKKIRKMEKGSIEIVREDEEQEEPVRESKIAQAYDEYFTAINNLVNSTMHSDRQFVQTTTVSAAYCFVPPKIMAFYNAYAYRLKQILKDESEREYNYTFLIYPSFSSSMSVKQISLKDDIPPCDRILTVTANEQTLYDIEAVICQLIHELAHYIGGDALRLRSIRRQKIIHTLVRWIADECKIDDMAYLRLLQYFDSATDDGKRNGIKAGTHQYLQSIYDLGRKIIRDMYEISKNDDFFTAEFEKVNDKNESFRDEFLESCGIEAKYQVDYTKYYKKQYHNVKYREFRDCIEKMNEPDTMVNYKNYIDLIKYVYSECYADLQMILVVAMNAEDYLNSFRINVDQKISTKRIIRISTIFRVMKDCGFWKEPTKQDSERFRAIYEVIREYNGTVERATEAERLRYAKKKAGMLRRENPGFSFKNGIKLKETMKKDMESTAGKMQEQKSVPMTDIAVGLYEYLIEVTERSLREYSNGDKPQKIQEVRMLIKEILAFKDVTSMFNCVESELESYKEVVYNL